jgi:hypothetical protein
MLLGPGRRVAGFEAIRECLQPFEHAVLVALRLLRRQHSLHDNEAISEKRFAPIASGGVSINLRLVLVVRHVAKVRRCGYRKEVGIRAKSIYTHLSSGDLGHLPARPR